MNVYLRVHVYSFSDMYIAINYRKANTLCAYDHMRRQMQLILLLIHTYALLLL